VARGVLKAVLLRGGSRGTLAAEVANVPVPTVGPGELLVNMRACGLCGTDIEKMRGEYSAAMPVLGHEAVGVISHVGEGVKGYLVGDRVFPHHHVPCHSCYFCQKGDETSCDGYKSSNLDPGGFAEAIRVPEWNVRGGGVLKLPPGIGFEVASLVEPLACCVRAIDACGVTRGDSVLVVGAGPVGAMHAMLLRYLGAEVFISDISKARLLFAESQSLGTVIEANRSDVPTKVRNQTDGRGADLAIVASGSPIAVTQALKSVRKGGKVCLFGIPVEGSILDYDLSKLYSASISVFPSYGAVEKDVQKASGIISDHKAELGALITHRLPLTGFQKGVDLMLRGEGMKVVIVSDSHA